MHWTCAGCSKNCGSWCWIYEPKGFQLKTTFSKKTREKGRFGSLTPWNVVPNNVSHNTFSISMCLSFTLSREQFVTFSLQEKHTFYTRERVIAIRIHTLFWKPFPWACQNSWNPFIQLVLINVVIGIPWCGLTFISFTIEYFPHTLAKKLYFANREHRKQYLLLALCSSKVSWMLTQCNVLSFLWETPNSDVKHDHSLHFIPYNLQCLSLLNKYWNKCCH